MTTQLADPWAPPAATICDFGWHDNSGSLFKTLSYVVNNVTYPPSDFTWSSGGSTYSSAYRTYVVPLNQTIIFDATDLLGLGLPAVITPTGVTIVSYRWDLGNGQTSIGPIVSTSYNYPAPPPDTRVRLTIVDSLDRTYTATHVLPLASLAFVSGSENVQRPGAART